MSKTREEKGFTRLQVLFWKELDESQRRSVLVKVGMLTADADSTAWLWRGLSAAIRQGKLQELWDEVMSCLSDDQQECNPFQSVEKERIFVIYSDFEPDGFVSGLDGVLAHFREELERIKDSENVKFEIRREDMTEERLALLPVQ